MRGLVGLAVLGLRIGGARPCSSDRGLHHVLQRFAVDVAAQFVCGYAHERGRELRARSADVRREQQIGAAPQRVAVGQRLRIGDVESGANPARIAARQPVRLYPRWARARH